MRHAASTCLLSLLLAPALSAWGALGHRLVASTALRDLPPGAAAWFAGREDLLAGHASDPDTWKDSDPGERPRHYLHCEAYGGAPSVPRDEAAARADLGDDLFQASGQVPWVVLERTDRLARAFADGDADQAALEASWLSHYIGDLHVPLHTTENHDGSRTGQHGVHHRWESKLLERLVDAGWTPDVRPARPSTDPAAAPFAWLRESNALVPAVLEDDRTARSQGLEEDPATRSAYWAVFTRLEGPRVEAQVDLAAQATATKILDAWAKAGKPPAPAR